MTICNFFMSMCSFSWEQHTDTNNGPSLGRQNSTPIAIVTTTAGSITFNSLLRWQRYYMYCSLHRLAVGQRPPAYTYCRPLRCCGGPGSLPRGFPRFPVQSRLGVPAPSPGSARSVFPGVPPTCRPGRSIGANFRNFLGRTFTHTVAGAG